MDDGFFVDDGLVDDGFGGRRFGGRWFWWTTVLVNDGFGGRWFWWTLVLVNDGLLPLKYRVTDNPIRSGSRITGF